MSRFNEIIDRRGLADFLGIKLEQLTYILYIANEDDLYYSFKIPKKGGGFREINAPKDNLKYIQKRLNESLHTFISSIRRENGIKINISHGFEKNKNIITNAKIHKNKRYVLNVDIKDFFPSIHFGRVCGFFQKNRYFMLSYEVAVMIAQIACYKGYLPQGAPSSPIIANLICGSMDLRILKLAKRYKLDYTRYADDLTFSTNYRKFETLHEAFLFEIEKVIVDSGFAINDKKTRLLYKDSHQEVTGLTVNRKVNINVSYYKKTRAMAETLYRTGSFFIDNKEGTLPQLEGRFSFINQIDWNDNKMKSVGNRRKFDSLNGREKSYQKFIFYKHFIANDKPVLMTEGKTDQVYIKAALRNMYSKYEELIEKDDNDKFRYKISFFKRNRRLEYFFNIPKDGGDAIIKTYRVNSGEKTPIKYRKYFVEDNNIRPKNVFVFLLDNEMESERPLKKFMLEFKEEKRNIIKCDLSNDLYTNLNDNIYLMCTPLIDGKKETEIEDLLNNEIKNYERISGRRFDQSGERGRSEGFFNKNEFSQYIAKNYKNINFDKFIPILDALNNIISGYSSGGTSTQN